MAKWHGSIIRWSSSCERRYSNMRAATSHSIPTQQLPETAFDAKPPPLPILACGPPALHAPTWSNRAVPRGAKHWSLSYCVREDATVYIAPGDTTQRQQTRVRQRGQ